MPKDVTETAMTDIILPDLLTLTAAAIAPAQSVFDKALESLRGMVTADGRVSASLIEANQGAAHGVAWLATYVEALRQMQKWAERVSEQGKFGEVEQLIHQIAFGEYLHHIAGGIPMNQGEVVRLQELGLGWDALSGFQCDEVQTLMARGNTQAARIRLVTLMQERNADITVGATGLEDELEMIREQFRRYAVEKVEPFAHDWHLKDELIPMEVIEELAEMGVFGLTIPEEYGGFGLSKASMVVVSEELSRGYIGVGSLGTRSEIAAELIEGGGTEAQKEYWLPRIASAEILPTAVFTEPNTGSDLGSLRTRAVKDANGDYKITGNKTWITHAARTHVMTLLARTDPNTTDYRGLSMFLAEKIPGTDEHHVALVMGEVTDAENVLCRIHSECLTGDVFHSARCDCGDQLEQALQMIAEEGRGVLLYLRQEGRGIGLINKIRAYNLQDQGMDTYDANIALGLPADMREYWMGNAMLEDLGVKSIRLMTNNPAKIIGLESFRVRITSRVPVPIKGAVGPELARYLRTKVERMDHRLDLDAIEETSQKPE